MAKVGRPLHYQTPEDLQAKIDEYFDSLDKKSIEEGRYRPYTLSGLARFLGFADRISCYDYEYRPEFSNTIKRARLRITEQWETLLAGPNAGGPIFMLKNLGYTDKQDLSLSGELNHTVRPDLSKLTDAELEALERIHSKLTGD